MAAAGVGCRIGREANSEFNEGGNGITGPQNGNQLPLGIDPYRVAGDVSSGLLPGVNESMGGQVGQADNKLQAYCYRTVLTDVRSNRIAIEKPIGYDEAAYEMLFRAIEVGQDSRFLKSRRCRIEKRIPTTTAVFPWTGSAATTATVGTGPP